MSMKGLRPATKSAIDRPVVGALVMPLWPWPKASKMRASLGSGPITGSESGVHGRRPIQSLAPANCKVLPICSITTDKGHCCEALVG